MEAIWLPLGIGGMIFLVYLGKGIYNYLSKDDYCCCEEEEEE